MKPTIGGYWHQLPACSALHPWQCTHHRNHSEIWAHVEARGEWEIVAVIFPSSGYSAETIATFIADVVNQYQQGGELLRDMRELLECVLEDGRLNFTTEQEADRLVKSIKLVA